MAIPVFLPSSLAHSVAFKQETVEKPCTRESLLRMGSQEVGNFERTMSEAYMLPTGVSKTFHIWALGSRRGRGGREVGTNARRLFFFLQIQENIILWKVEVIKQCIHPLHDL